MKRLSIGAVLLFFVISLLCWADAGSWAHGIPLNVVSLLQDTLAASIPLILGALAGCMGERAGRDQHRDRGAAAVRRVHRRGRGERGRERSGSA